MRLEQYLGWADRGIDHTPPASASIRRNRRTAAAIRRQLASLNLAIAKHSYRSLRLADEALIRSGDDPELRREAYRAQRQFLGALEQAIPRLPAGLSRAPWLLNVERAR